MANRNSPQQQQQPQINQRLTDQQQQLLASSASISSEDIDLEESEEEEEEDDDDDGLDALSAPDFPAQFLRSNNRKPIDIYQSIDEQQIKNIKKQQQQLTNQQQQQQQQQQHQQLLNNQQLTNLQPHHQELYQQEQQQQLQLQQLSLIKQNQKQIQHPTSLPNLTDTLTHRSVNHSNTQNSSQRRIPPPSSNHLSSSTQKPTLDSNIPNISDQHQTNFSNLLPCPAATPKPSAKKSNEPQTSSQSPHLEPPRSNSNNLNNNNHNLNINHNNLNINNNLINNSRYPIHPIQPQNTPSTDQQPSGTLTTTGAEATWGTAPRPNSRASIQPTPTSRSKPQTSAPTTHRSRMGSSDDHNIPPVMQRPRRVSDGSINGGVRKDLLLQRMAEALQSERAKALVFQKELQNAEREIDELANTLDEQRRIHHKTIVALKKDIKLLKKERESLVEALEAAEGVEQEEAERYLALLDPAAQALMVEDEEVDDPNDHQRQPKHHQHSVPPPQPIFDDYDISDYKSTIRAQMQERSALRAQRINSELLKINPSSSSDPNAIDSEKEVSEQQVRGGGGGQQRQGRTSEPTNRIRRKLSKSRPSSRDGNGGGVSVGLFWRRSGSRNRENYEEKSSSAPGTVYGKPTERRKASNGNQTSIIQHHNDDESGGYYDSGPLQRSSESFGNRSNNQGKIGKLFRKVFPTYRDNPQHPGGEEEGNFPEMTNNYERSPPVNNNKKPIHSEFNHDRNHVAHRRRRSVLD